jgi:hypothetical protein
MAIGSARASRQISNGWNEQEAFWHRASGARSVLDSSGTRGRFGAWRKFS